MPFEIAESATMYSKQKMASNY